MADDKVAEKYVRPIAIESLATFKTIADAASAVLSSSGFSSGPGSFAAINTFTSGLAVQNRERIVEQSSQAYRALVREPAIARVTVSDEKNQRVTFYFSRNAPVPLSDPNLKLASYKSPVGKLAELDIGDEHSIPRNGKMVRVEILEYARFRPTRLHDEWDSHNSLFEGKKYGPFSIVSLRAFLEPVPSIDEDVLRELLRQESKETNIREGIRRSVISKMDLRDQPVLDKYQGEIFRMPLNSRLLLLGPPGTGKTTTLIRRLSHKLELTSLEDADRQQIRDDKDYLTSWIMFTPTELLRLYVKEAFNRENIPAPDERIRTWAEVRENFARNEFRILRSPTSGSSLVMKENVRTLEKSVEANQIDWFSDFDRWQRSAFWEEITIAARSLGEHRSAEIARLGARVITIIEGAGSTPQPSVFGSLASVGGEMLTLANTMKKNTDEKISRGLNLQLNRDRTLLDKIAAHIADFSDTGEDLEDQEVEDEEEIQQLRSGDRAAAVAAYMRAVRAQARAVVRKRNVPRNSRSGRLLRFLGDRTLAQQDLADVGSSLILQSDLRTFANPVRRYIDGVPARYRRFRRLRQEEARWYRADGFSPVDLNPLEVDVVLLAMMRETAELITGVPALLEAETSARATLERLKRLYRTQVFVDEATDFSPIQLACMATLASPATKSFFACGDFNQRLTSWGLRSHEQIKWVLPDIDSMSVEIAYRQSEQLHNLAVKIARTFGDVNAAMMPKNVDNKGVPPALATTMADRSNIAAWLAERIVEIERFVGELPSVAVLVNSESEVQPMAHMLGQALANHTISVEACFEGKIFGRDGAVRVFDVQHIKGLEFEAVFFIGLDQLAQVQPELFDRYLYVGATRAATYLGLTCAGKLPAPLETLGPLFVERWA